MQTQEAAKTGSVNNVLLKLQPWCSACTAKGDFLLQTACQAGKSDSVNSRNKFTFRGDCSAGREALELRASLETCRSLVSSHILLWHSKECFALSPVASYGLSHPQAKLQAEENAWLWVSAWGYTILDKFCFLGGNSDAGGNCNVGVFF